MSLVCSFEKHPFSRPVLNCTHEPKDCSYNKHPLCRPCFDQAKIDSEACFQADRAKIANCPDCQAAQAARNARIQAEETIDPNQPWGQHISLTCRNHPHLTWSTKNIDYIGARSIFFNGFFQGLTECTCSARHLVPCSQLELEEIH